MNDIKVLIWLFPILFIFHDFEEIIFMKSWINRNRYYLHERFPKISKIMLPHFDKITTSSFALGVAEEFILISIITVVSYMANQFILWAGLFIAFILHLVIHCFQTFIVRKYVPAVITSVICLPVCIYIINHTVRLFQLNTVVMYTMLSFVIMVLNLVIIHKGMDIFSIWLAKYEQES